MKYATSLAILLFSSRLLSAQTIAIDSLSGTTFCVGDELTVSYHSTGIFDAGNRFILQSDTSASFNHFTTLAIDSISSGKFRLRLTQPADHLRFRVISSAPYVVSAEYSGVALVMDYPSPKVDVWKPTINAMASLSLVGKQVRFISRANSSDSILWQFPPDATPLTSTERQPLVSFSSPGIK
jgi:hypothetical protein